MKTFVGHLEGSDMTAAIIAARSKKPGVRNLYGRMKDSKLELFIRTKVKGGFVDEQDEHVVHTVDCKSIDIDDRLDTDPGPYNGYPICISISKYNQALENGAAPGMNFKRGASCGFGVACACTLGKK